MLEPQPIIAKTALSLREITAGKYLAVRLKALIALKRAKPSQTLNNKNGELEPENKYLNQEAKEEPVENR